MIRRLQRQFVAIAMISLLFIIVAIVGAINGFNLRQINSTADAILELLARNGGVFRTPILPAWSLLLTATWC